MPAFRGSKAGGFAGNLTACFYFGLERIGKYNRAVFLWVLLLLKLFGLLEDADQINALHIRQVSKLANGKINRPKGAASLLGIRPNTLRKRMDKLGIPYRQRVEHKIL